MCTEFEKFPYLYQGLYLKKFFFTLYFFIPFSNFTNTYNSFDVQIATNKSMVAHIKVSSSLQLMIFDCTFDNRKFTITSHVSDLHPKQAV